MAICLVTIASPSLVWGESFSKDMYVAIDGIASPGNNNILGTRLEFGIQPNQGWGAELSAISSDILFFVPMMSCGCADSSSTYLGGRPLALSRVNSYELFGTYTHEVSDRIHLTAKLGVVHAAYTVWMTPGITGNYYDLENTSTNIGGGIGAEIRVFSKVSLRFQYESIRISSYGTGINRIAFSSTGLAFKFD